MDWLVPLAKKLGWTTKATYYSHSDYNGWGRKAWRAAMSTTYNFVKDALRLKRLRDQKKEQKKEAALQKKRARLLKDQRSLTATDGSPSQVDTYDTDAAASAHASAVPEAFPTAPLPVTANASAAASTTAEVTAGDATGSETRFDVPTTITLLHAGLLQLRATIHQLGSGGGHPSNGYADVLAQEALQTQRTHVT